MGQSTCRICGVKFAQTTPSNVICSPPCRQHARRESSAAYARRQGNGPQHRTITCAQCGEDFSGVLNPKRKYCSGRCEGQAEWARRKKRDGIDANRQATCSVCGVNVPGKYQYNRKCGDCIGRKDVEHRRQRERKRALARYGLTPEGFDQILEQQGGCCAICMTADPGPTDFHVDHCHENGNVRGLLCHHCNTMLGLAQDDPRILIEAMRYLGVIVGPCQWFTGDKLSRWQTPSDPVAQA